MKPLFLTFILSLSLLSSTHVLATEADPEHVKLVEEYLQLAKIDKMMENYVDQAQKQQADMLKARSAVLSPEAVAIVTKYSDQMNEVTREALSWDSLKPEFTNLFLEHLTKEDLESINAFYRSPAGKKVIEKSPEFAEAGMRIGHQKMSEILPKITELSMAMAQEIQVFQSSALNDAFALTPTEGTEDPA